MAALNGRSPDPTSLLGVLEHLLEARPETVRLGVWSRLLGVFLRSKSQRPTCSSELLLHLLDLVGRSGLRPLAPHLVSQLGNPDPDVVLGAIVGLAQLGVPDADLPAEALLNETQPALTQTVRWALAFLESGDVDLLSGLLQTVEWRGRIKCLRLIETVLARPETAGKLGQDWRSHAGDS